MKYRTDSEVEVWVTCYTVNDCDMLIDWLQLAKQNLRRWEQINAKVSRASKAATRKNEDTKQGKILCAT